MKSGRIIMTAASEAFYSIEMRTAEDAFQTVEK